MNNTVYCTIVCVYSYSYSHSHTYRPSFSKEPVGVVLCIAPWNFPLLTSINCIIPAILAGNSVVIKHSPRSPLCADAFATVFKAAGAPEDLVTALHCSHDTLAEAIKHDSVGFVSFTGSVEGGHAGTWTRKSRTIRVRAYACVCIWRVCVVVCTRVVLVVVV